jgi:DNA-binding beta-propeller fold protein YncE
MTKIEGARAGGACLLMTAALAALAAGCGDDQVRVPPTTTEVSDGLCASGQICTVAGTGIAGDGQDDLPARETRLYLPQDMTLGPGGRLFVVDWNNHRIRVIEANSHMRIVAGIGELGPSVDDPASERLNHPTNITFDPMGLPDQLVIAAWHNSRIKRVFLGSGEIVDVCGDGRRGFAGNGGPAAMATLDLPVGVAFDGAGNLLIADQANQMIRKVDRTTDVITTIAGIGHCADSVNPDPCVLADGGPAIEAGFHFPIGQAASPGGRIAVGADGSIYVADTENFRLRRIGPDGMINTIAGTGVWGFAGDGGPAAQAQLGRLTDVAVGPDGRIYVADTDNSCVRVLSPDGTISTFAGQCGQRGFAGDDGPAAAALLNRPYGVEVTSKGEVYIADTHNHRIRIVYP